MILHALKEYYDRKASDPESNIAPLGFEWKEIPYIIVLNTSGEPVSLNATYEGEGKKRQAKKYLIPQSVKRTVGICANLLWDNAEYTLGYCSTEFNDDLAEQAKILKRHIAFQEKINTLAQTMQTTDDGINALRKFLLKDDKLATLQKLDAWKDFVANDQKGNISFQLAGDTSPIFERTAIKKTLLSIRESSNLNTTVCLVTGSSEALEITHSAIKGVMGAQSSGANIVSFNLDAFKSYGKEQGENAPVGKTAAFAYTTALNHLLRKDSQQRLQVGDATAVFWAERTSDLETQMVDFFSEPPKDDPDRGVNAVKSLYKSIDAGAFADEGGQNRFYVLGLSPNASRLSIRFWMVDTITNLSIKIAQHFKDLEIIHGPRERDVLSIFRLLTCTAIQGKSENISHNLAGNIMKSILEGTPYPQTLLQSTINRIRAESGITYPRASIIKAYLNRIDRFKNPNSKENLNVSLDETNINIGYRLGRLFATLEKIQCEASPGINATIRDRFYGAASSTPISVFGNLMRLKNHHLSKIDNPGRRVNLEKLLGDILSEVNDFPPFLSLEDQGRFAIGYYHQMQSFYTPKTI